MSGNFNYSLVKNDEGNIVVRSVVNSYNLDHVTDKSVVSFYNNFSSYASFDTGLLPLDGTGILAIRSAGPHTQVVTQHKPGMYYVNWGAHEGARDAKAYYVAQPYRVVIGDFVNGNLLGARMFYSPVPITSPDNPLYHVNLPNINCKGYRGNGVGWICLYLNDDWSNLPFNEKVTRFIERCSGVETYNDANMSETDGPRFYQSYDKPSYFWDPSDWQSHSEANGYEWTLDDNLLIPVLVRGLDDQTSHYNSGVQLTFGMAILGNYQAYYTDTDIPKMYNVVSRSDLDITPEQVSNLVTRSFANAPATYVYNSKNNPYDFTIQHRKENGAEVAKPLPLFEDSEDHFTWTCSCCEEDFDQDETPIQSEHENSICSICATDSYTYLEHLDMYVHNDSTKLYYSEALSEYFHEDYDSIFTCDSCYEHFGSYKQTSLSLNNLNKFIYKLPTSVPAEFAICRSCYESHYENNYENDNNYSLNTCHGTLCNRLIILSDADDSDFIKHYSHIVSLSPNIDDPDKPHVNTIQYFCTSCAPSYYVCPCGILKNKHNSQLNPVSQTNFSVETSLGFEEVCVSACCDDCVGSVSVEEFNSGMNSKYQPFNINYVKTYVSLGLHKDNPLHDPKVNVFDLNQIVVNFNNDEPF